MNNYLNQLKHCPLFDGINEHDIETMLTCLAAREQAYKKDAYILLAGNTVTEIGIVISGSVIVIKEDYWGNRTIISKMTEGDMFAESYSCADMKKLTVSVVAAEPSTILFIDYKRIITTCSSSCVFHTMLIKNMIGILANKNMMLTQKMEHTSCRTTRDKLLSYLSSQALASKTKPFAIPFNRQELADYLCVDRSAMSNELSKLRDEGILTFQKNYFELM